MNIALDIDDVLAGYVIGLHKAFNRTLEPHNHWQKDGACGQMIFKYPENPDNFEFSQEYLDKCEHNKDFWYNLPVISLPININFQVACYITSSPENMVQVRESWLERHGFPKAPVIHCKQKHVTMKQLSVDVLVDDKLSTIQKVRENKLLGLHFKPWYSNLEEEYSISNILDVTYNLMMRYEF